MLKRLPPINTESTDNGSAVRSKYSRPTPSHGDDKKDNFSYAEFTLNKKDISKKFFIYFVNNII